jgi:hypothetical protein
MHVEKNVSHTLYGATDRNYFSWLMADDWCGRDKAQLRFMLAHKTHVLTETRVVLWPAVVLCCHLLVVMARLWRGAETDRQAEVCHWRSTAIWHVTFAPKLQFRFGLLGYAVLFLYIYLIIKSQQALYLLVTEKRCWALFYMSMYRPIHNLLNALVQIANKMGFKRKKKLIINAFDAIFFSSSVHISSNCRAVANKTKITKLRDLSPRANYTNPVTAACQRN